jgi:hypothetical protein
MAAHPESVHARALLEMDIATFPEFPPESLVCTVTDLTETVNGSGRFQSRLFLLRSRHPAIVCGCLATVRSANRTPAGRR